MPHPPHSPWFEVPNNIWGRVQILKLLAVQLPSFSCHFIPLWFKYSLRTLFSNTLSLCFWGWQHVKRHPLIAEMVLKCTLHNLSEL
jgi:hypothetical protein